MQDCSWAATLLPKLPSAAARQFELRVTVCSFTVQTFSDLLNDAQFPNRTRAPGSGVPSVARHKEVFPKGEIAISWPRAPTKAVAQTTKVENLLGENMGVKGREMIAVRVGRIDLYIIEVFALTFLR